MPLFREWSPDAHSLAAIWHIEEPEDFFLAIDSVRGAVDLRSIPHPRRRLEHLAGRYLLQHLQEDFPLHHILKDRHDKPRLPENRYFFSISHSHPYVAAVISDSRDCGIDIQVWHPRIGRISHKFLSPEESALCGEDPRMLTLAWCGKEAAYKWNGRRGADFIHDLPISDIVGVRAPDPEGGIAGIYYVPMKCFGEPITPHSAIYKDFALSLLVREHQRINE